MQAQVEAQAQYKSDALDELIEGSIFKKKDKVTDKNEDFVDAALHAKVDPNLFNVGGE